MTTEEEKRKNPYFSLNILNGLACDELSAGPDSEEAPQKRTRRQVMNQTQEGDPSQVPGPNGGFCETCSVPELLDTEYQFLQLYMYLEEKERFKIGHNFSDLVKSCTFRGRDCKEERFVMSPLVH